MSLSELEAKRIEKEVRTFVEEHRPPPHIRPKVDLGFRVKGQSVEIFELRPRWRHPEEKVEHPVAKATYVKTRRIWKVYWQRADLKWHQYSPNPQVGTLKEFLAIVDRDDYGCFFG
ncbi:MAG: hypothetical protein Kow0020_01480 [Wenzhouxiangellaceae bacterium]